MAGNWIKMRCNLWTHPKVSLIASRCSVTKAHAIGALHGLWSIADQHSDGGSVANLTAEMIDAAVELPGFSEAVAQVGWLVLAEESTQLPRYQEHNGSTAKTRAQSALRASKHRNADVTLDRDATVTREDKIREDKRREEKTPPPPSFRKFVPPTVMEVTAYCRERSNGIDAESFIDHYEANGWHRGKTPIKDWRACVRTWEKDRTKQEPVKPKIAQPLSGELLEEYKRNPRDPKWLQ
jgi:hypothetical protein